MPLAVGYRGFDVAKHRINRGIYDGSWFTILANIYSVLWRFTAKSSQHIRHSNVPFKQWWRHRTSGFQA
jgi:hypothetical protein